MEPRRQMLDEVQCLSLVPLSSAPVCPVGSVDALLLYALSFSVPALTLVRCILAL